MSETLVKHELRSSESEWSSEGRVNIGELLCSIYVKPQVKMEWKGCGIECTTSESLTTRFHYLNHWCGMKCMQFRMLNTQYFSLQYSVHWALPMSIYSTLWAYVLTGRLNIKTSILVIPSWTNPNTSSFWWPHHLDLAVTLNPWLL